MRWAEWKFLCPEDVPMQKDGSSCGIYVCLFVRSLLTGEPMNDDITADDISKARVMILRELLSAERCEKPYYVTLEDGVPANTSVPTLTREKRRSLGQCSHQHD